MNPDKFTAMTLEEIIKYWRERRFFNKKKAKKKDKKEE